jgi:hypothetical protein
MIDAKANTVPRRISEQQHPALQTAEIQLAIFEHIRDDRQSLANAARVNSAWWSLAVPYL